MYMPAKIHLGAFMYVHKYCDVYGCVCVRIRTALAFSIALQLVLLLSSIIAVEGARRLR